MEYRELNREGGRAGGGLGWRGEGGTRQNLRVQAPKLRPNFALRLGRKLRPNCEKTCAQNAPGPKADPGAAGELVSKVIKPVGDGNRSPRVEDVVPP